MHAGYLSKKNSFEDSLRMVKTLHIISQIPLMRMSDHKKMNFLGKILRILGQAKARSDIDRRSSQT